MIGTLALGVFAFQTVLVVGGPGGSRAPGYDPILHIVPGRDAVRPVREVKKGGVTLRMKGKPTRASVPPRSEKPKPGVKIVDASSGRQRMEPPPAIPGVDQDRRRESAVLGQSLETARERRVCLPLLRRLDRAQWHLQRGRRQVRTDLRAQSELHLADRHFQSLSRDLTHLIRTQARSPAIASKLRRVKKLADQGAVGSWLARARLEIRRRSPQRANPWIQKAFRANPYDPVLLALKTHVDSLLGKAGR